MSRPDVTFDTGALIALENKTKRMRMLVDLAIKKEITITVPAAVLIEWWRGSAQQRKILRDLVIEPLTEQLAKSAGRAAGVVNATPVDACVMASAAMRGDMVFTSHFDDLDALRSTFPKVIVMRAG